MMGGWELAIPQTGENKDLGWELLAIMVDPKIIVHSWSKMDFFQHRRL
jgi:hypothetical protein